MLVGEHPVSTPWNIWPAAVKYFIKTRRDHDDLKQSSNLTWAWKEAGELLLLDLIAF